MAAVSAFGVIGTVLLLISPCLIIGAGAIWWDIWRRRDLERRSGVSPRTAIIIVVAAWFLFVPVPLAVFAILMIP